MAVSGACWNFNLACPEKMISHVTNGWIVYSRSGRSLLSESGRSREIIVP